ncbi:MAG: response regulator transcription factor [Anaerolineales bacterium]|nr:response regulator transcription factor [Anaerolineales bacterium]
MAKIRILLADDHTVLREATAELIDNQPDMQVVGQAGTGEDTLALTKALQPDIVVMDIAMPRMDGLESTRQVTRECPRTRVIILSAHQDSEHVIQLLQAGAMSYLPKTISLNELLEAIRLTSRGESVLPPAIASVVVQCLSGNSQEKDKITLSSREVDVLQLVARGFTNERIAHDLQLSTRTIEAHLTHIFNKLNVNSRTEAALYALHKGWIRQE